MPVTAQRAGGSRLTWSGMYARAAPWNARDFGRANRS